MVILDSLLTGSLCQSSINTEQLIVEQEQEIRRLKEENERLRERIRTLEAVESHNNTLSVTKFSFLRANTISIGKKVGEGSFGAVYRGQWRGITCAVKFLSKSVAAQLQNEVSIMDQIDHPNIVRLYGVVLHNEPVPEQWPKGLSPPCLVMEYVGHSYSSDKNTKYHSRNRTSNTFIDYLLATKELRKQQEHWVALAGMLQGAARGMAYLHSRGVMHRDLKGVNLLLDSRGNLKIADLGLATLVANKKLDAIATAGTWKEAPLKPPTPPAGSRDPQFHMTGLTTGAGTYTHMAPEVMASGNYNTPADVFSFGIIISEAIAGSEAEDIVDETRTPEFGIDTSKLVQLAGENCGKIVHQLVSLAGQCCAMDPAQRPTANQIVGRLQMILFEYQTSRLKVVNVKEDSMYRSGLRKAMESEASKKVFGMADKNQDGYLCYDEMKWLAKASGDKDLSKQDYETICDAIGANSAKGLTKSHVLKLYRDMRAGDAVEDCQILSSLQQRLSQECQPHFVKE